MFPEIRRSSGKEGTRILLKCSSHVGNHLSYDGKGAAQRITRWTLAPKIHKSTVNPSSFRDRNFWWMHNLHHNWVAGQTMLDFNEHHLKKKLESKYTLDRIECKITISCELSTFFWLLGPVLSAHFHARIWLFFSQMHISLLLKRAQTKLSSHSFFIVLGFWRKISYNYRDVMTEITHFLKF